MKRCIKSLLRNWDAIRPTSECPHCNGTGRAPSADGRTECGFCEREQA